MGKSTTIVISFKRVCDKPEEVGFKGLKHSQLQLFHRQERNSLTQTVSNGSREYSWCGLSTSFTCNQSEWEWEFSLHFDEEGVQITQYGVKQASRMIWWNCWYSAFKRTPLDDVLLWHYYNCYCYTLFSVCWCKYKQEYSSRCKAWTKIFWNIVSTRVWNLIWIWCVCKHSHCH